jgi:hypothetical protein
MVLLAHRVSVHRSPADTLANGRAARAQHHTIRCRQVQLAAVPESREYGSTGLYPRGSGAQPPMLPIVVGPLTAVVAQLGQARARVSEYI